MLYLEKTHPDDKFRYMHTHASQSMGEKDMESFRNELEEAELIIFSYPVYTFLVPYQLVRLIENLRKEGITLDGKWVTQFSTSKHFFDTTAHKYLEENLVDMNAKFIPGLSGDMEDLLTEEGRKELDEALEVITRYHEQISILHCVSQYPTAPDNLNLLTITYLKRHYGQYAIGFSDHTIGIAAPVAAVALGAEIVEKHITIDRRMKGTDQQGSLGPDGVNRMIRDIRLAERWLGREELYIEPAVAAARIKLERSIATRYDLQPGDVIKEEDLHLLSPGDGYKWADRAQVIGRQVKNFIPRNELIYPKDLC